MQRHKAKERQSEVESVTNRILRKVGGFIKLLCDKNSVFRLPAVFACGRIKGFCLFLFGLCLAAVGAAAQTEPPKIEGRGLQGHTGFVYCVAFAPDGKTLASGSEDGTIRVWDAESGKELYQLVEDPPARIRCLAFTPDGKTLVASVMALKYCDKCMRGIQLWDLKTRKVRQTIEFTSWVLDGAVAGRQADRHEQRRRRRSQPLSVGRGDWKESGSLGRGRFLLRRPLRSRRTASR